MSRPIGSGLYNETYCDNLIEEMSQGKLNIEVIAKWGISKKTFYRWVEKYPDLHDAYEIGLVHCEAWWVKFGRECAIRGDDKGFKYFISIMNNKFAWGKDDAKGTTNQTINISNMNVLATKTETELLEILNNKLNNLNLVEQIESVNVPATTTKLVIDGELSND